MGKPSLQTRHPQRETDRVKDQATCGGLVFGTYLNRDYTNSISDIAAMFQSMCFSS